MQIGFFLVQKEPLLLEHVGGLEYFGQPPYNAVQIQMELYYIKPFKCIE